MLVDVSNGLVSYIDSGERVGLEDKKKLLESIDTSVKLHIVDADESLIDTYKENTDILKKDFGYLMNI